jgi:hypothetical protein
VYELLCQTHPDGWNYMDAVKALDKPQPAVSTNPDNNPKSPLPWTTKLIDGIIDGTNYQYVPKMVIYKDGRYIASAPLVSVGYLGGTQEKRDASENCVAGMIDALNAYPSLQQRVQQQANAFANLRKEIEQNLNAVDWREQSTYGVNDAIADAFQTVEQALAGSTPAPNPLEQRVADMEKALRTLRSHISQTDIDDFGHDGSLVPKTDVMKYIDAVLNAKS